MVAEIVVVGSANLDLVVDVARIPRPGETVLGGDLRRIPGGKGANQAVAAARLGRSVAMVGRVGDDEGGGILREALDGDGVDTSNLIETVDTPSGVALIAVGEDGDNAIVVSPGANGRVSVEDMDAAERTIGEADCVLLQLEIPIRAVEAAAERARGTVILNPAPAPTEELSPELIGRVDVLVPNESELATLSGHRGDVGLDTAAALARRLPSAAVVVTLGADGALVVADDEVHVPAPSVVPVDTTAAGDSFCAALADGIVSGRSLVEATRWAVRVGAATTLRPGAQPSLPTASEVDELLAAVTS